MNGLGRAANILSAHGVALESALAATLLLRDFTFRLPMVPGLRLTRRELRERGDQRRCSWRLLSERRDPVRRRAVNPRRNCLR